MLNLSLLQTFNLACGAKLIAAVRFKVVFVCCCMLYRTMQSHCYHPANFCRGKLANKKFIKKAAAHSGAQPVISLTCKKKLIQRQQHQLSPKKFILHQLSSPQSSTIQMRELSVPSDCTTRRFRFKCKHNVCIYFGFSRILQTKDKRKKYAVKSVLCQQTTKGGRENLFPVFTIQYLYFEGSFSVLTINSLNLCRVPLQIYLQSNL